ncbi:hypothetical protein ADK75_13275 [Streptomyces virginiae]|uniref:Uncharacterized protein n=1 Tax=Streptomyces virginiae TaxID=1961 RepID=A0A0L8MWW4_STRVG|nr:hypothetical protein ADK75_13275 [Streptomyces virginiae]
MHVRLQRFPKSLETFRREVNFVKGLLTFVIKSRKTIGFNIFDALAVKVINLLEASICDDSLPSDFGNRFVDSRLIFPALTNRD